MPILAQLSILRNLFITRVRGLLSYLRYDYRLTKWLYFREYRNNSDFFKRYFNFFIRIFLLVLGAVTVALVLWYTTPKFTSEVLSGYLFTTAAMLGGVIAIVFTISIFLLQGAADLFSSQYFEVYINNWKERVIYFLVTAITIFFLGAGLYIGSFGKDAEISSDIVKVVVSSSILGVVIVFILIDWQYSSVSKKINPLQAIKFLQERGLVYLMRMDKEAKLIASVIEAQDSKITPEMALAATYNRYLQPHINNLDKQLEFLVAISMKLSDRQELTTTKLALDAVHNMFVKFFNIRKNTFIAIPSSVAILAIESDIQHFLASNCERLNRAGSKFMREGKDENATYIVDVYNSLAVNAKDLTYLGRKDENPILESLEGYLNLYLENAVNENNLEVVYRGIGTLGSIGSIFSETGLEPALLALIRKFREIISFSIRQKHMTLLNKCTTNLLILLQSLFQSTKISPAHFIDEILENLADISNYIFKLRQAGLVSSDALSNISLSKPYEDLMTTILEIVSVTFKIKDKQEKLRYQSNLLNLLEESYKSLRQLSEKLKNCDGTLARTIGGFIYNINKLLLQLIVHGDFARYKAQLVGILISNIHLPYWFVRYSSTFDGSSTAFTTLLESTSNTGVLAYRIYPNEKIIRESVKSLYSMVQQCLVKTTSTSGYDEPRALEKLCYIGILALKNQHASVLDEVVLSIYEFEEEYFKKYFTNNFPPNVDPINHNIIGLAHKNELLRELLQWREGFISRGYGGLPNIFDESDAIIHELVDVNDIDRFIFEVWGHIPLDSMVGPTITDTYNKRVGINMLVNVLNRRISDPHHSSGGY